MSSETGKGREFFTRKEVTPQRNTGSSSRSDSSSSLDGSLIYTKNVPEQRPPAIVEDDMSMLEEMSRREGDFHHEARVGDDSVVASDEGYQIISSYIRNDDIVLMGDIHTRRDHHELFLNYMRRMVREGIDFSIALELPHQLNSLIPEMTAEMILNHGSYYYSLAGYGGLGEIWRADVLPILQLAKDENIPVLCVDDVREKKRSYYTAQANRSTEAEYDNNYRNEFMAGQLLEAKRVSDKPILGMLGNNHTKLGAVPASIDAFSVHMGEVDYARTSFAQGSFDLQIKTDLL